MQEMNELPPRAALRHEAFRRRLLKTFEHCLPEWSKIVTIEYLDGFVHWLSRAMPPEIRLLEGGAGQITDASVPENESAAAAGALAAETKERCLRCGQVLGKAGLPLNWYPGMRDDKAQGTTAVPEPPDPPVAPVVTGQAEQAKKPRGPRKKRPSTDPVANAWHSGLRLIPIDPDEKR